MKKRTGALLMALVMLFGLMAPAASAVELDSATEAVYLGLKDFEAKNVSSSVPESAEDFFVHRFFVDGEEVEYTIATGKDDKYAIQNQLMEGYIYNITVEGDAVTAVELQDKGVITMGTVESVGDLGDKPVYEITTQAGGATVTEIEASDLADDDTVKVTENAVYKAFVAEEYEAPVAGTPGKKTLKNFLTTALQPVGTALYVFGGAWDWQDDVSSNQSMTIGIPQSWVDFFQSQDTYYDFKEETPEGKAGIPGYYTSNRGWNQYYYAGVDCSAYTGWIVYNVTNTESGVVPTGEGYVGSSTKQAKNFAAEGWGTWNHDTAAVAEAGELKVGDIVSMYGHVWIVLGVCDDGSVVFMHSTPSNSRDGEPGGGIQIASLNPNGDNDYDCEAYKLADRYMSKYYPQWYERYAISQKGYTSYLGTSSNSNAGIFSWDLTGEGLLTDPDGYADMTPAEILADIFGEVQGEAVYLGLENFNEMNTKTGDESTFVHKFFMDGEIKTFTIGGEEENFPIQNQLMEGYIYNIIAALGEVESVTLKDKGAIIMGAVSEMNAEDFEGKPVYEITTQAGGATVTEIEVSDLADDDTVKVTPNAVYKTFVSEDYTPPVSYIPGQTTLRNFLTTALYPVGTALYVYGGTWDWQDDVSSNQSMTIGLAQSWVDFFQSQDGTYDYKDADEDDNAGLPSYYTSNRGWNQYYYAGVDCSAYTGWVVYNITNTEDSTVVNNENGYVGSSTKQAKNLAAKGWGTWDHDTAAVAAAGELKVGDIVSMSGHVWVVLGVCDDGSIVFMHSTPSNSREEKGNQPGGGIQIASLNPNGQNDTDCEAYELADYYMSTYYPQWYERYAISQKSYSSYLQTYTSGTAGTWAGVFSWDLTGNGLLVDPDGFADMKPAEILAIIFGEAEGPTFETEAVYRGLQEFGKVKGDSKYDVDEGYFIHEFVIDGVEVAYPIADTELFSIENKLMEGYIYNITVTDGVVTDVSVADEGVVASGKVQSVKKGGIVTVGGEEFTNLPVYEIEQGIEADTTVVTRIDGVKKGDSVKVTENAIYKTFVAKKYTAPVEGTPGEKTLKNFLTTALQPVGTALYVYGGAWDWQDSYSSLQSMTIGIPQSWIDFFQRQDGTYTYRDNSNVPGSYYTSNRGWNQYYYAGVDCSAYVGWTVYNVLNTENGTVNTDGYVGSSTKQAYNFAQNEGWGTFDEGERVLKEDGSIYKDGDGDTYRTWTSEDFKVGDIFSDNSHVWICLGVCEDGSMVFMHSTPSDSKEGYSGGGIQIASLDPNGNNTTCEAYELAEYYMTNYYSQWTDRYDVSPKSWSSYVRVYDSGSPEDPDNYSFSKAGKFSWNLGEGGLLSDPDGYADMTPAEILADIFPAIEEEGGSNGDVYVPSKPVEPVKPAEPEVSYDDVAEDHWAAEAIAAVSEAGLFKGTSESTFDPEADTTRGQLMTVLARLAGEEAGDIADGVEWAVANGISDGTGHNDKLTREQLVTMLWRYAKLKGMDVTAGAALDFADADKVSDYAVEAMQWACAKGIIKGMTETTLVPGGTATRAQIAVIMQRFANL